MIKRWFFGRKFRITADVYKDGGWAPIKRHFWSGGLLTGRKVKVISALLTRRGRVSTSHVDNLRCVPLGLMGGPVPEFVWPKGLWDNG